MRDLVDKLWLRAKMSVEGVYPRSLTVEETLYGKAASRITQLEAQLTEAHALMDAAINRFYNYEGDPAYDAMVAYKESSDVR